MSRYLRLLQQLTLISQVYTVVYCHISVRKQRNCPTLSYRKNNQARQCLGIRLGTAAQVDLLVDRMARREGDL
ncbi:hypothetical protein BJX66DRAFT_290082 [Aspergillus keveii]|uniref:Secreted protein n=1 Tax=Aspergillus keveii TaxID=714993 RepID=A0ABR4GNU9_9EURO